MPEWIIEDTLTGLKVPLEGPEEPSQAVAHKAITNELNDLYTNLYSFPGGKFMLDVGPLQKTRELGDSVADLGEEIKEIENLQRMYDQASDAAKKRREIINRRNPPDWSKEITVDEQTNLYRKLLNEELAILKAKQPKRPEHQQTFKMLSTIPENSLMLISHGSQKGGLYTDWEHEFTLHNVAKIMGQNSNAVRNVYNLACYGGKCLAKDYEAAFPNVTNVQHTSFTNPNIISIGAIESGKLFGSGTNVVDWERWEKQNGQWNQITNAVNSTPEE